MQKISGHNLRRLREAKGWSQKVLAEKTGTLTPQISAIENGRRGIGKALMLKFVRALGCDPSDFYVPVNDAHPERRKQDNYLKRALIERILRALDEEKDNGQLELMIRIERVLRKKEHEPKKAA